MTLTNLMHSFYRDVINHYEKLAYVIQILYLQVIINRQYTQVSSILFVGINLRGLSEDNSFKET